MAPRWQVLPFTTSSAAAQLAQTDQLLSSVAAGQTPATLRWYSYDAPALVLGVGQSESEIDTRAAKAADVPVVRRSAGGAAVLANPTLIALDVALPSSSPLAVTDVVESYRWLGEAFLTVLAALAPAALLALVSVTQARSDRAAQAASALDTPDYLRGRACFGTLSPYEVALGVPGAASRKLIGLSQVRKRGVVLYQAGVYTRFSGAVMAGLLAVDAAGRSLLGAELDRRVASLDDLQAGDDLDGRLKQALNRRLTGQEASTDAE